MEVPAVVTAVTAEADAEADADAEAENNNPRTPLANQRPLIHGPLFVDCVGCYLPTCHGPL